MKKELDITPLVDYFLGMWFLAIFSGGDIQKIKAVKSSLAFKNWVKCNPRYIDDEV